MVSRWFKDFDLKMTNLFSAFNQNNMDSILEKYRQAEYCEKFPIYPIFKMNVARGSKLHIRPSKISGVLRSQWKIHTSCILNRCFSCLRCIVRCDLRGSHPALLSSGHHIGECPLINVNLARL